MAKEFTGTLILIAEILRADIDGTLVRSRLRNQADFYSLVGAIHALQESRKLPDVETVASRLKSFIATVDDPALREKFSPAAAYYAASRSASNDQGPRQTRINMISGAISGELPHSEV